MRLLNIVLILIVTSCSFFPKEEVLLSKCSISKDLEIRAYYVALGATTNEVVQLRKASSNGEEIIEVFENYNEATIISATDTSCLIILNYTGLGLKNEPDSFKVYF